MWEMAMQKYMKNRRKGYRPIPYPAQVYYTTWSSRSASALFWNNAFGTTLLEQRFWDNNL
jgi:hypothetical protein